MALAGHLNLNNSLFTIDDNSIAYRNAIKSTKGRGTLVIENANVPSSRHALSGQKLTLDRINMLPSIACKYSVTTIYVGIECQYTMDDKTQLTQFEEKM